MNCAQAERLLTRSLDGEADAASRAALEAHLAACPRCRSTAQAWRQAGRMLRDQPVPAPTAEAMWADVRRAIRQLPREAAAPAPLLGWRLGWAAAIVAAVFVGVVGVATWMGHSARTVALADTTPTVEWVEAEMPDSSPMVYEDEESGVVVIWLMTADEDAAAPKGS